MRTRLGRPGLPTLPCGGGFRRGHGGNLLHDVRHQVGRRLPGRKIVEQRFQPLELGGPPSYRRCARSARQCGVPPAMRARHPVWRSVEPRHSNQSSSGSQPSNSSPRRCRAVYSLDLTVLTGTPIASRCSRRRGPRSASGPLPRDARGSETSAPPESADAVRCAPTSRKGRPRSPPESQSPRYRAADCAGCLGIRSPECDTPN